MKYKYIHDIEKKQVFRVPESPDVIKNPGSGGWSLSMQIDTMMADNAMNSDRSWKKPLRVFPEQLFNDNYTEAQVISYFLANNTPPGEEITKEEYLLLNKKYESECRNS